MEQSTHSPGPSPRKAGTSEVRDRTPGTFGRSEVWIATYVDQLVHGATRLEALREADAAVSWSSAPRPELPSTGGTAPA